MNTNDKGLPYLTKELLNEIFENVYEYPKKSLKTSMTEENGRNQQSDFISVIKNLQEYNVRYRLEQTNELFPLFERTVGPMETNSDGTTYWLAMGLAIKDLYGMRKSTLEQLLNQITIRK
ncbi:hypothetical protein [Paenisporosarcina sp. NPDC076898]|uniref:hypothetical protein n=1 Tax=unclassified Paenisporosarcina TaxID=2642018 RepID=UPI003D04D313